MKKNLPRKGKGIAFNVSMLYIMNIAKLVFPLITLPYLTRVLSVDCYGVVSYVKATMVYAQLVVDFGFMLFSRGQSYYRSTRRQGAGRQDHGECDTGEGDAVYRISGGYRNGSAFYSDLAREYAIYDTGIYSDRTVDTFAGILIPRA